ncbi:MAG: SDR family NAD(P)-dependent oxidoreductase [Steroidobacteraceae bacterium]
MASNQPAASGSPLAVITGASSGIGLEIARAAAADGYSLLLVADTPFDEALSVLRPSNAHIQTLEADLATLDGVDELLDALDGRTPDVLVANAGHGLGEGFLDENIDDALHVIDTNVTGTVYLIHHVGRSMRAAGKGRILITGSIAGFMPGAFQAVYNGTKAFIDSFSWALRNELKDSGVSVTCLMPGVTDTEFFDRAGLTDTQVGASKNKMDPADVARIGWKAMLDGDGDVVAGLKNKLQAAIANITPAALLAEQHRKMAEPGSASN